MTGPEKAILRFGCEVRAEKLRLSGRGPALASCGPLFVAPYFDVVGAGQRANFRDAFLARRRVGYEWNEFFLYLYQTVPMEAAMTLVYTLAHPEEVTQTASGAVAPPEVRSASMARLGRMSMAYADLAGENIARRLSSLVGELLPPRAFVQYVESQKPTPELVADSANEELDLVYFWTLLAREAVLAALNDRVAGRVGDDPQTVVCEQARTNPMFEHLTGLSDEEFMRFLREWHREIQFPTPLGKRLIAAAQRIGIKRVPIEAHCCGT